MKKYSVLIVEDDVELAKLTTEFLQEFEFNCDTLHLADPVVDYVSQNKPDLVLLDVMLPDGDGWTYVAGLRASSTAILLC